MNQINCNVIDDLLPLYEEQLTCADTNALVEEHLKNCESCRAKQTKMKAAVTLPQENPEVVKEIGKKIYHGKIMAVGITLLLTLAFCVIALVHLNAKIYLPYESVAESISVTKDGDMLIIAISDSNYAMEVETTNLDGDVYHEVLCYSTRLMQLTKQSIMCEQTVSEAPVYYGTTLSGEAVCIYETEHAFSGGYIILTSHVLIFYTFVAGALLVIGIICCAIFRKKKVLEILLKITAVPLCYCVSSWIMLSGVADMYNTAYYFSGIVCLTIILSVICFWIIGSILRKERTV